MFFELFSFITRNEDDTKPRQDEKSEEETFEGRNKPVQDYLYVPDI